MGSVQSKKSLPHPMFLGRSLIKLTAPQPDPKMTTRGFCDPLSNFKVCESFDCVPLTSVTGAATACMHVKPHHLATATVSILCLILYVDMLSTVPVRVEL